MIGEETEKVSRSLRVRNLPPGFTEKQLMEVLSACGNIEEMITFEKETFIVFNDPDAKEVAEAFNGFEFSNYEGYGVDYILEITQATRLTPEPEVEDDAPLGGGSGTIILDDAGN